MDARNTFIRILGRQKTKQARQMNNVFIESVNGSCTIVDDQHYQYNHSAEEVNDQLADALLLTNNNYVENLNLSCVFINGQSTQLNRFTDLRVSQQGHSARNRGNIFINKINGNCDFFIENNIMVCGVSQDIRAQQDERKINNIFIEKVNGNISFHHFFSSNNSLPSNIFINKLNGNCRFVFKKGTDNGDTRNMSDQSREVKEKQVKHRNNFYLNKINGQFDNSMKASSTRLNQYHKCQRIYHKYNRMSSISSSTSERAHLRSNSPLNTFKESCSSINGQKITNMNAYDPNTGSRITITNCVIIGSSNFFQNIICSNKTYTNSREKDRNEERKLTEKRRMKQTIYRTGSSSEISRNTIPSEGSVNAASDDTSLGSISRSSSDKSHSDISSRSECRSSSEESRDGASYDTSVGSSLFVSRSPAGESRNAASDDTSLGSSRSESRSPAEESRNAASDDTSVGSSRSESRSPAEESRKAASDNTSLDEDCNG